MKRILITSTIYFIAFFAGCTLFTNWQFLEIISAALVLYFGCIILFGIARLFGLFIAMYYLLRTSNRAGCE